MGKYSSSVIKFTLIIISYLWAPILSELVYYNDSAATGDTVTNYHNESAVRIFLRYVNKQTIKNLRKDANNINSHQLESSRFLDSLSHDSGYGTISSVDRTSSNVSTIDRIYYMKRCGGAGCPYTASWLIHINLYMKTKVWLDSTKMEAASFLIYDAAYFKFQLSDTASYFVHHMSMYEHLQHKRYGFEVAKNKTLIMSVAAYRGECGLDNEKLFVQSQREFLAIVPFYGGLPPNVTRDLSVKSLGQGNSLVDASTKALQCMATICSCLKYYGHVALGVTRSEDRELMIRMIDDTAARNPSIKERIHIIQFAMKKPAHLPFHLMAWAQNYIQWYNCQGPQYFPHPLQYIQSNTSHKTVSSSRKLSLKARRSGLDGNSILSSSVHKKHNRVKLSALAYSSRLYASSNIYSNDSEVFRICNVNFKKHHIGGPVEVTYHRRSLIHRHDAEEYHEPWTSDSTYGSTGDSFFEYKNRSTDIYHETLDNGISKISKHTAPINYYHPIRYIYYTECDQIVHYDSMSTFEALTAASNDTTFFTGKRREKDVDSDAIDYLGSLNIYRNCGVKGYSLRWPKEHIVRGDEIVSD